MAHEHHHHTHEHPLTLAERKAALHQYIDAMDEETLAGFEELIAALHDEPAPAREQTQDGHRH